ncbi:hypothetical protein DNTS_032958 [Danionella cerebrum]|uniref:Uncharacterized protein n=1 Tax=Danionella cerebrum TaxID=2873325 RepID=A0A553Q2G5_9TELE|nr:hypothetical protein DNTS_032958 [Danionella translucida]
MMKRGLLDRCLLQTGCKRSCGAVRGLARPASTLSGHRQ